MLEKQKFWLILALFIGIFHCVLVFYCNWGDAVIHLVFAKNFALGHFFEYNIGEKASGSTSPIWTGLLSLVYTLTPNNFVYSSKIFTIIIYLFSLLLIYFVGSKLYGDKTIGLLSLFLWTSFANLAEYSAVGMETALYIAILLLSLLLNILLFNNNFTHKTQIFALGFTLGMIPVIRPEGVVFSLLNFGFIALFWKRNAPPFSHIILLLLSFFLSFSPYYLFSYIQMGHLIPNSGQGRLLAAYEFAKKTFGIYWSPEVIKLLLKPVLLICLLLAVHGLLSLKKRQYTYFISSIISSWIIWNILFFSVIFPESWHTERYIYPMYPFLVLLAAYGLYDYVTYLKTKLNQSQVIALLMVFFFIINSMGLITSYLNSKSAVPFDIVIEKELCDWLNSNTDKADLILTYEVQEKYCLDRNIISLDGIIDGKIVPYFYKKSNLLDFLKKYKPKYWEVNDAIFYRKIYAGTVLREVAQQFQNMQKTEYEIKGIKFKVIKKRPPHLPSYPNFAEYKYVLKIDYLIS
jgi:hypothetical protein